MEFISMMFDLESIRNYEGSIGVFTMGFTASALIGFIWFYILIAYCYRGEYQ